MGEKENADVIFPVHFQIFVWFVFLSPNATGEIPTTTQQQGKKEMSSSSYFTFILIYI
jgi:hypothetical protein